MVMLHIKEIHKCSNMVANIIPPQPWGWGSVGQNSTFLEHGRVAYQIKENQECSNRVTNILPADPCTPPYDPRDGVNRSKCNFFRIWEYGPVAFQIRGNHEMQQHGSKYFACRPPYPPMTLGMGSIDQNST